MSMKGVQERATVIRATRQEELRAYLSERNRVRHLLDNIEIIEKLDSSESNKNFKNEIKKWATATELRLKVLNKYLPDAKEEVLEVDTSRPIQITIMKPDGAD